MLDELREQANSATFLEEDVGVARRERSTYREKRFLGMTAFQRFVLAMLLFLITCVLGTVCLIVAQKVVPGFLTY